MAVGERRGVGGEPRGAAVRGIVNASYRGRAQRTCRNPDLVARAIYVVDADDGIALGIEAADADLGPGPREPFGATGSAALNERRVVLPPPPGWSKTLG